MTQNGAVQATQRAPRWMVTALVVSLALNLIVVGSIAGTMWRFRSGPPDKVTPNLLGFASTLSAERRRELWESTEGERQKVRPFRREVRAAREATLNVLVSEPFDKQRFIDAQVRQAEAELRARDAVQKLYAELAEKMTPEERRSFRRWREKLRPPGRNLLDEPDVQAGQAGKR